MLAIRVETENGRRYVEPAAGELDGLVRRIGGDGDRFLVVQRVPDLPDVFIQVWHEESGDYLLEHRAGDPGRHFQVALDDPGTVAATMTAWARLAPDWDAGLAWEPLAFPPAAPVPPLELDEAERRDLEECVRTALAGGYVTRDGLAELAEDHLVSGDRRPVTPDQARHLADRMWLERVAEQAGWPVETDPDRVHRAFTALESTGVTARENFTCCSTCGHAEIAESGAPDARGFVFFHHQSTDAVAAGHGLTLHYGGFDDSPETTTAVGHEVVAALRAEGLTVEWDGDARKAITVAPLTWQKRLVG
ncbi:hypothetical protein GCM10010218_29670 [Streptomyces mashuensis]|uniref:DUF6891 domain-containing protein n=1 Tax=Streptomyces mashuensis TaxID=33904 RepID=A0A919B2I4_9ACTN|nr:hypothetical protein [Streptomyces mashuensis]GHF46460.1 hypothetical protein GCM10010218_29670 [Streptomyces mashuensis]